MPPVPPSITAKAGRLFILKVESPDTPGTYLTVGGLRSTGMSINNNPVDITNVASNGFRELLPDGGVQAFSFNCDGIFDSQTPGFAVLWDAAQNRTLLGSQIISGHGDTFEGYLVVGNLTRTGSFDNAETFSCTLESSGEITYTPAGTP